MADFSQFFSSSPWGSWGGAPQGPLPAQPDVPPEMIAALRRHFGLDEPDQAQSAAEAAAARIRAPYVKANERQSGLVDLANRAQPLDLTPAHLPGTEPKDYLRELYRNPDILARNVEQAGAFNFGGIMAGPLAKTANLAALENAKGLLKAGASKEDIWNKTGWFQGADDKWRFEIPDQGAAMKPAAPTPHRLDIAQDIFESQGHPRHLFANPKYSAETSAALKAADDQLAAQADPHRPLSTFVEHPQLYSAYPPVGEIPTMKQQSFGYKGSFLPGEEPHLSFADTIGAGPRAQSDTLGTILHEAQHAVQNIEGTARGANTFGLSPKTPAWDIYQERLRAIRDGGNVTREEFSKRAGYDGLAPVKDYNDFVKSTKRIDPSIDRAAQEYAVQEAYRRHAGEVEARNVQSRKDMTPEQRRASPPWTTEDVPREQQIVRGASSGPQMSVEPPGITAYHGSPHDFDKFDIGKIGTGEGAQAYGHGLYFAENPEVTNQYRAMGSQRVSVGDQSFTLPPNSTPSKPDELAARALALYGGDKQKALNWLAERRQKAAAKWLTGKLDQPVQVNAPGHGYQVSIKAPPEHFLDWDKPLSEQHPHVQEGVKGIYPGGNISGSDWYRQAGINHLMEGKVPPNNRAAQYESVATALREAGIPGIKYLDQGSRGKGDGTRNYVVFDDKLIDILKKYGLAGLAALPALGAMQGQPSGRKPFGSFAPGGM